jgi:hypothetical protein
MFLGTGLIYGPPQSVSQALRRLQLIDTAASHASGTKKTLPHKSSSQGVQATTPEI